MDERSVLIVVQVCGAIASIVMLIASMVKLRGLVRVVVVGILGILLLVSMVYWFEGLVRVVVVGILMLSIGYFVGRSRRRETSDNSRRGETSDAFEEVIVWPSRAKSYPKLAEAIEKTTNKIIAHDNLWLGDHAVQVAVEEALRRGVEVELILGDPESAMYKYRFQLIAKMKSRQVLPEWIPEWIPEWQRDYNKFELIFAPYLFSDPFVLVDDVLYLGMFSPNAESDRMPLFEISTQTRAGKTLWKYIERWQNSLRSSGDLKATQTREGVR